ncbi:hypothetical protein RKD49_006062 [Streptomyces glaucescens]|uniref:hypothetical protein n=1 Tax=unclassified Streptomyces TaxID=2593676 RepID=UPI00093BB681|nr:hypothetical protein [Streptomyces sp. TSRI0107]OKJ89419.1 hypothetical protein AMK31_05620 [Streptomyces sp. TSRI0107]
MHQPPAQRDVEAAAREPNPAAGAHVWESDLTDLAALPLAAVDMLTPLRPDARLLAEVLRSRSSIRGGEPRPDPSGRAE